MESPKQEKTPSETPGNEAGMEEPKAENGLLREQLKERDERIEYLEKELDYLKKERHIDPLTGASDRTVLEKEVEQSLKMIRGEIKELREGIKPLAEISLIAIDIDMFKNINDMFGHSAGDEVLKKIVALLMDSVREGDVVARLSGGADELMISLRGANEQFAVGKAEKMQKQIEQMTFDAYPELKVTASFGVVSSKSSTDAKTLEKMADDTLFSAKRAGRNQVVVYKKDEK